MNMKAEKKMNCRIRLCSAIGLFAVFVPISQAALLGSDGTAATVPKEETRLLRKVMKGIVVMTANVRIEPTDASKIGVATTGALAGAVLSGDRKAVQGAVVGGVVGAATALGLGTQKGQDIVIATEPDGELVSVTQATDDNSAGFTEGDKVLLVYSGEKARVILNTIGQPKPEPVLPPVSDARVQPVVK